MPFASYGCNSMKHTMSMQDTIAGRRNEDMAMFEDPGFRLLGFHRS